MRRASEQGRIEVAAGRQRLMTLLESMSDGVVVIDDGWHVVFFNDQAADILGGAGRLHLGADFWSVFPIGQATEFADRLKSIAAERSSFESEEYQAMGDMWLSIGASGVLPRRFREPAGARGNQPHGAARCVDRAGQPAVLPKKS